MMRLKLSPRSERLLAVGLVSAALILLLIFFEQLPIENTSLGIDWRGLWEGLRGGQLQYGNATGLRIAPWDALIVLPLGWFSFRASWGLLTALTLAVLVLSVPRHPNLRWRWLGIVLLTTSFPALRLIVDGNFEALVIGGVLLCLAGYARQQPWLTAAGLLLATAKVQETWLVMMVLGVYVLQTWPRRGWLTLGGVLAVVVVPCLLWLGRAWLMGMVSIEQRGSILDVSLGAALTRLNLPLGFVIAGWILLASSTLLLVWFSDWELTREKAALLIAASLLLAPYAAGNSFLTVVAIGIIPLIFTRPWLGGALMLLTDLPYFANQDLLYHWQAYYWTILLLLAWAGCAWSGRSKWANVPHVIGNSLL